MPNESHHYKAVLFVFTAICLAILTLAHGASAATPSPADDAPSSLSFDPGMPPLEGGALASPPPVASSPRPPLSSAPTSGPSITIWQGLTQYAGRLGDPQKWFNVVGNVAAPPPATITALVYSLNDGPWLPLNIGPNDRRLAMPGDFNVEVDYTDLLPGANEVALRATDSDGNTTYRDVTIVYEGGGLEWTPGTHVYDWSTATQVSDLAQMVDGPWLLDGDSVRPGVFDFDRLLAIGDLTWRDYTITVPVTIYGIDPSGYKAPSNGPGIGLLVRWAGHYDSGNGIVPLAGWRRLGALAWYRWSKKSGVYTEGLQLLGHGGKTLDTKARILSPHTTYLFKVDIQSAASAADPATYRFKVWPAANPEPAGWDIVKPGVKGEPSGGSFLLLAHHVDARFGAVTVDLKSTRPLPSLIVNRNGPGSVRLDPPGPTYRFGEDVTLTAEPAPGGTFTGWTGVLAGAPNPATVSLFESLTAGATFEGEAPADAPFYVSPAAKGQTADGIAFKPADILRYDPATGWSMWFQGADVAITKNLSAFEILESGDILMAFAAAQPVPGLGMIMPHDIVRFVPTQLGAATAGTFALELDGSDFDLSTSGEKIDALAATGDGRWALSTTGTAAVGLPGGGILKGQDEGALIIDPPTGEWAAWFDGTAVGGLKGEDLNGLWIDPDTGDLYISLVDAFNLGGLGSPNVRGNGQDIVRLRPTGDGYAATLWWDGSAAGFPTGIDALAIER